MADETKVHDLVNGKVQIAEGLVLEDRLRLGTVLYLEKKFGKSLTEIFEAMGAAAPNFTQISTILTGLYIQSHPEVTETQAEQAVGRLDLEEVTGAFAKLRFAEFAPKNVSPPASPAAPS